MKLTYRWALIIITIAISIYYLLPFNNKMKLGLDLKGGMHVVLGVDVDEAVSARLSNLTGQIRKDIVSNDVELSYIKKESQRIIIALSDNKYDKAIKILKDNYPILKEASLSKDKRIIELVLDEAEVKRIKDYAVDQALQIIRNRIDQFGVNEPSIQRQGENQVLVQLPGIADPDRAIELIGKTAQLKFYLVDDKISQGDVIAGNIPYDDVILYQKVVDKYTGAVKSTVPFVLKSEAVLTGDYLSDAEVRISPDYNEPYVLIRFDSAGAKLFEEITTNNVGKRLAIVLDNNVYSAPVIREAIAGGQAQITGSFAMDEAKDLAIVLRAGSLPAPVQIQENRTVGPSLGKDSIESGFKASVLAFALVVIFIGFYYRLSGVFADIAMFLNFVYILAIMSLFKATLTLPGIAGLILTIGMSVDANILIFERIREELTIGRTTVNAIEAGFEKAMSAIIDSNITTLIAAAVLFQFGTGPVKGFAVTLSIGLIASLFTAIFVTKTFFQSLYLKGAKKTVSI
jgi:preprotein translocase subunit SecD